MKPRAPRATGPDLFRSRTAEPGHPYVFHQNPQNWNQPHVLPLNHSCTTQGPAQSETTLTNKQKKTRTHKRDHLGGSQRY